MIVQNWGGRLRALFSVPVDNPELMQAQYAAFSRQVPLLYAILLTNTWSVAVTHFDAAPLYLALYIPLALTAVGVYRVASWWRTRNIPVSAEHTRRMLKGTNRLAVVLGVCFLVWGIALYPYGDAYAHGHVAFYMGITVIGCIFCLMHLRSAALIVTLIVNVGFFAFFATRGVPVLGAMAVNVLLVSVALLVILWSYYRDFTHLIDSRKALMVQQRELVERQAETQALSDANYRLANSDSLTGLPNRRGFFAALDARLAEAGDAERFAVGIVDLDGFKPVNDVNGHIVGDALLVEVGRRLGAICGADVFLSRLGGDEFGVIMRDARADADIERLGRRICEAMHEPFVLSADIIHISGSMGFAAFPDAARAADALFERADYALYNAKRNAPGGAVLFSDDLEAEMRRDDAIEHALRAADLDAELSVVFQPMVDCRTSRPIGFEALARWQSPELGPVPPSVFIPAAERANQIGRLTRVLLAKALAEAATWPADQRVSFNLSAKDIATAEAVMRITAIIVTSGVDPARIDLEITETAVMHDYGQARAAIAAFKRLGVGISLDDFGTGYSSLTHLHTLPLDKIKIDRSFIADICENPASYKIVRSLISLSRDMDLGCVVEGVETETVLDMLIRLGATMIQGYHYAAPMPAEAVCRYLEAALGAGRMRRPA